MTDTEKALQLQVEQLSLERDLLRKKCLQSQAAYTLLMQQLKAFMRHRFGQRSERYQDSDNPQSLLFDNNSPTEGESPLPESSFSEYPDKNVVDIKDHQRRKKTNKSFASHLPRKEVVIPVAAHHKTCQCGSQKPVIRHQRHERLNYLPPVYEVIVELREVVACPAGCKSGILTAPKPKHILPKARFTESILAHILVSKFDDRQPFYHLESKRSINPILLRSDQACHSLVFTHSGERHEPGSMASSHPGLQEQRSKKKRICQRA